MLVTWKLLFLGATHAQRGFETRAGGNGGGASRYDGVGTTYDGYSFSAPVNECVQYAATFCSPQKPFSSTLQIYFAASNPQGTVYAVEAAA